MSQAQVPGGEILRQWKLVLGGALLWWLLGLNLLIYHAAAFFLLCFLLGQKRFSVSGFYVPPSANALLFLIAVYGFSIAVHAASSQTSRVIAACYNLSFWVMGASLIIAMANVFRLEEIPGIVTAFKRTAILIACLTAVVLVLVMRHQEAVEIRSPLFSMAKFLGNTSLVKDSLVIRPLMVDWFASYSRPRLNLLAPYPTASAGLVVILIFFLMTDFAMHRRTTPFSWFGLLALNVTALALTLSRMSMLALFVSGLFVWFVGKKHLFFWTLFSGALFLLAIPWIVPFSEWLMGLRSGSTSTRMDLYRYTLDQLNGADWILGVGIKAREETFAIPIGSHSTYISLLYKSGLLGLGLFLWFQLRLFLSWFHLRELSRTRRNYFLFWRVCGYVFLGMGLWMLTEDIDAPQMLAFVYFSIVGLFEGFRKELLNARKPRAGDAARESGAVDFRN